MGASALNQSELQAEWAALRGGRLPSEKEASPGERQAESLEGEPEATSRPHAPETR